MITTLPWLDIQQTADYLHLSTHTVYKLVSRGEIPFKKIGNGQKAKLIFARKKLDLWLIYGKTSGFTKREKEIAETWI